jgi:hypothetical protein
MEAAFGRLHNSGAVAFGACPTVVESIMGEHMCIKYARVCISCLGLMNPLSRPGQGAALDMYAAVVWTTRQALSQPEPISDMADDGNRGYLREGHWLLLHWGEKQLCVSGRVFSVLRDHWLLEWGLLQHEHGAGEHEE